MSRRRALGRILLFVGLVGPAALNFGVAAAGETDRPGKIQIATYRATAFSYQMNGSLLWLTGSDGIVRLEIRQSGATGRNLPSVEALLNQQGQGWTAIFGGQGAGTLNGWGQAWRQPPTGLARAVGLVSAALLAGPPVGEGIAGPWRAKSLPGQLARYCVPSLNSISEESEIEIGLRHNLTGRGWGRGGADEVLEMVWQPVSAYAETELLRVRLTRRPGRVDLQLHDSLDVVYASPEAFVPLWPLGELITIEP